MRPVTRRRGIPPSAPALGLASLAAILVMSSVARAQPPESLVGRPSASDEGGAGFASPEIGAENIRDALSHEIARLRADIAGLERLMRWQEDLARIARTDPAEALRQRRPMADCLASALAPLCGELTGLFRPEDGEEDSPMPPGIEEGAP